MPETGYNELYDLQGNLISREPVVISDDQLLMRALAEESNAEHTNVLRALGHWDQLTLAQKDRLFKFLVGFYLVAGERLQLFRVD